MKIYRKLKLGIVGHGFVGKATDWGFNKRVSKFIVDPLLDTNILNLKEFEPEIVLFVSQHQCVTMVVKTHQLLKMLLRN